MADPLEAVEQIGEDVAEANDDKELWDLDHSWEALYAIYEVAFGYKLEGAKAIKALWAKAKAPLIEAINPKTGRMSWLVIGTNDPVRQKANLVQYFAVNYPQTNLRSYLDVEDIAAQAITNNSPLLGHYGADLCPPGVKLTRAIHHIALNYYGFSEVAAASISQTVGATLSGDKSRTAVISVNPLDIGLMSESAFFKTCHRIFGERAGGPAQFLQDPHTAICYTYTTLRPLILWQQSHQTVVPGHALLPYKTWRQLIFFCPAQKSAAHCRQYGNTMAFNDPCYQDIRRRSARLLMKLTNAKEKSFRFAKPHPRGQTVRASGADVAYPDPFTESHGACSVLLAGGDRPQAHLGNPLCLGCAENAASSSRVLCSCCTAPRCHSCNFALPGESLSTTGHRFKNRIYCRKCFDKIAFHCNNCNGMFEIATAVTALCRGHESKTGHICRTCATTYTHCHNCNCLAYPKDLTLSNDDDRLRCYRCQRRHYWQCPICTTHHPKPDPETSTLSYIKKCHRCDDAKISSVTSCALCSNTASTKITVFSTIDLPSFGLRKGNPICPSCFKHTHSAYMAATTKPMPPPPAKTVTLGTSLLAQLGSTASEAPRPADEMPF